MQFKIQEKFMEFHLNNFELHDTIMEFHFLKLELQDNVLEFEAFWTGQGSSLAIKGARSPKI